MHSVLLLARRSLWRKKNAVGALLLCIALTLAAISSSVQWSTRSWQAMPAGISVHGSIFTLGDARSDSSVRRYNMGTVLAINEALDTSPAILMASSGGMLIEAFAGDWRRSVRLEAVQLNALGALGIRMIASNADLARLPDACAVRQSLALESKLQLGDTLNLGETRCTVSLIVSNDFHGLVGEANEVWIDMAHVRGSFLPLTASESMINGAGLYWIFVHTSHNAAEIGERLRNITAPLGYVDGTRSIDLRLTEGLATDPIARRLMTDNLQRYTFALVFVLLSSVLVSVLLIMQLRSGRENALRLMAILGASAATPVYFSLSLVIQLALCSTALAMLAAPMVSGWVALDPSVFGYFAKLQSLQTPSGWTHLWSISLTFWGVVALLCCLIEWGLHFKNTLASAFSARSLARLSWIGLLMLFAVLTTLIVVQQFRQVRGLLAAPLGLQTDLMVYAPRFAPDFFFSGMRVDSRALHAALEDLQDSGLVRGIGMSSDFPGRGSPVTRSFTMSQSICQNDIAARDVQTTAEAMVVLTGSAAAVNGRWPVANTELAISNSFALRCFGASGTALGRSLIDTAGQSAVVVGVVADVVFDLRKLDSDVVAYRMPDELVLSTHILATGVQDPTLLSTRLLQILRNMEPGIGGMSIRSLDSLSSTSRRPLLLLALVLAGMSLLTIMTAMLGVQAMLAESLRTGLKDLAIRAAMGAPPAKLVQVSIFGFVLAFALAVLLALMLMPVIRSSSVGELLLAQYHWLDLWSSAVLASAVLAPVLLLPILRLLRSGALNGQLMIGRNES